MLGMKSSAPCVSNADKGHNHALDGLRFLAFLLVFFFHALQYSRWGHWPIIRFGYLGVPIFFVLSGFLIGRILLDLRDRERPGYGFGAKLKTFYIRRSLRIFPVYYMFIAVMVALRVMSGNDDPVARDSLLWHLTYLTNFRSFHVGMNRIHEGHFWSLAVEEHFYLVAPLIVLLVRHKTLERLLAGVIVAVALARSSIYLAGSGRDFWVLSPMQFDLLGLGIATAIIEKKGTFLGIGAAGLRRIGWAGAVFFALFVIRAHWHIKALGIVFATFGPISLGLATAATVLTLWQRPASLGSRIFAWRPVAYLGQISYGLYLFHPNCIGWTSHYFGNYNLTNTFVGLLVTFGVAILSWHAFEKPINNLKCRFGYEKRRVQEPAAEAAAAPMAVPET
jgi:peptidoglycan/LPS O-acetylase OafA/YrhL